MFTNIYKNPRDHAIKMNGNTLFSSGSAISPNRRRRLITVIMKTESEKMGNKEVGQLVDTDYRWAARELRDTNMIRHTGETLFL